jgi:hypothetical protein
VRIGSSFNNNKAAEWLPNGALVILSDYLSSKYGLTSPGCSLNQVTSISQDRKTLAGTATNGCGFVEGWLLTLPDSIEIASPEPDVAVRVKSVGTNGGSQTFGTVQINSGIYPKVLCYISNPGSSALSISAASITGANPDDFEIFNAPGAGLTGSYGVNEIRALEIRLNPTAGAEGARTAFDSDQRRPRYGIVRHLQRRKRHRPTCAYGSGSRIGKFSLHSQRPVQPPRPAR